MATLSRIVIPWSGTAVVGGGVSVIHCVPGDEHALMTAFRAFLVTTQGNFPTALTWSFPSAGSTIEAATNETNGAWADGAPPANISGLSANTWVNGVGIRVKWTTSTFVGGHRVVGSTFFVPLQINAYEGAGNIVAVNLGQFQSAAATLAATTLLRIYHRPKVGGDGSFHSCTGADVPDKVSWLRGRRT